MFGDVTVSGADEVKQNWDEVKRREKKGGSDRTDPGRPRPGTLLFPREDLSTCDPIMDRIGSEPAAVTGTNGGSLG